MPRRRRFLTASILLGTLGAPAQALAQRPVELRMWTLLSGGDGARMRALVDAYNASRRGVRVLATTLKWGEPFYTKLITRSRPARPGNRGRRPRPDCCSIKFVTFPLHSFVLSS